MQVRIEQIDEHPTCGLYCTGHCSEQIVLLTCTLFEESIIIPYVAQFKHWFLRSTRKSSVLSSQRCEKSMIKSRHWCGIVRFFEMLCNRENRENLHRHWLIWLSQWVSVRVHFSKISYIFFEMRVYIFLHRCDEENELVHILRRNRCLNRTAKGLAPILRGGVLINLIRAVRLE